MNKVLPYFNQEYAYSCSLAVLRMILSYNNIQVTEKELIRKIEKDYGRDFQNIWNPTFAKLAQMYGLQTTMYALWPLFKPELFKRAVDEYRRNPETFDVMKYENPNDTDTISEPLPLSYKEMFDAVTLGCKIVYKSLTESMIKKQLSEGNLIQTSIKLHHMYPGKKHAFHSILIFDYRNSKLMYHDPTYGASLTCTIKHLLTAAMDVGVCIVYNKVF